MSTQPSLKSSSTAPAAAEVPPVVVTVGANADGDAADDGVEEVVEEIVGPDATEPTVLPFEPWDRKASP